MRFAKIVLLSLVALSASCADQTPPPAVAAQPDAQKTVIDAQLKALEKAKAVQGTVDQQKKDADKKIEDAGG